jgi:hypothetical protein
MISTFHTYPDLVTLTGERLAETRWHEYSAATPAEGVAATLNNDHQAIILRVTCSGLADVVVGLRPGGLAA